jgi:signal transduction histidine kinase
MFGVGLVAPWAGALLNLIAGGGLLLAWTAWMRNVRIADSEFEDIQQARLVEANAQAAEAGAAAVGRRIHETILNTLAGISMGLAEETQQRAQLTCQRDLEQLNRGLDKLDDSLISEIIDSAKAALRGSALTTTVTITNDIALGASTANAIRDAVTESLRNVERHSGVRHAVVDVTAADEIVISISDDGVGPQASAQERFGTRNSIRANLSAVGGTATISRREAGGTVVTLHVPLTQPHTQPNPTFPILGIADSTPLGRIGATGTNIFMLAITPVVIRELELPGLTAIAIISYVVAMLALALLWTSQARTALVILALALLPLPFLVAGQGTLTCVAAPGVQGLITGMAGGGILLLLIAATGVWIRFGVVLIAVMASAWLSIQLPNTCEQEALLSTAVTAIYMVAIAIVLIWIDLGFDSRRAEAQQEWERLLSERVERERHVGEQSGWAAVPTSTQDLLEGIASGYTKVSDPQTQARAAHEADVLRRRLGISKDSSSSLDQLVAAVTPYADTFDITLEVESLATTSRNDPLPDRIVDLVERLVQRIPPSTMWIRAIVDSGWEELVIVLPLVKYSDLVIDTVEDVVIEFQTEGELLYLSLRRPVHSP